MFEKLKVYSASALQISGTGFRVLACKVATLSALRENRRQENSKL
jgi:hypothetical protein